MRRTNGFTLIELLVVITIIVVLAGLLIPGVLRAMKQAKSNRALSEMQHLATVITQVYSEVGYYVRLEDLARNESGASGNVRRWLTADYNTNGRNDGDIAIANTLNYTAGGDLDVLAMWNDEPRTTYKNSAASLPTSTPATSVTAGYRPIDPWGNPTGSDTDKANHQYRMFWIHKTTAPAGTQLIVPVGATGAMVIISAGGDGVYNCNIFGTIPKPSTALTANFKDFDPSSNKGDDVYYIFNAGIQ